MSVYYSVVDICCQKLQIAMVISKIKCGILSHTRWLWIVSFLFIVALFLQKCQTRKDSSFWLEVLEEHLKKKKTNEI